MSDRLPTARFAAIGTTVTVAVTDPVALEEARAVVEAYVDDLDLAASRFRRDSELSRCNAAAGRPQQVSALFCDLVDVALAAAESTNGAVSPTVGEAMRLLGYDCDFAELAPCGPAVTAVARAVPGWQAIRLDRDRRTLSVPAGVELDLGATAKARCADLAAGAVVAATGAGTLVSLGGDLAVAGPAPDRGWTIRVADRHDATDDDPGVTVAVTSGGLATSGTAARRWQRGGRLLHHIVDPATSKPAPECWRTVTVAAPSCLEANTASTAAVVVGRAAPALLADRRVHARLVAADGTVVAVGGWPADALVASGGRSSASRESTCC